jgi:hypothetical protein
MAPAIAPDRHVSMLPPKRFYTTKTQSGLADHFAFAPANFDLVGPFLVSRRSRSPLSTVPAGILPLPQCSPTVAFDDTSLPWLGINT